MAPPLRYALNTSTIRGASGMPLERSAGIAIEAGYQGFEPWVAEIEAFLEQGGSLSSLRTRLMDGGVSAANLIGFFAWAADDPAERARALEDAKRAFGHAAALGCPYVAAPPYGIKDQTGMDRGALAERYAALVEAGRDFGVVPLLEYWGVAKSLGRLGESLGVAIDSGRPEAQLLIDVFHSYKGAGDLEAWRWLPAGSVGLVHVNDYPADPPRAKATDADRVFPGDGQAPWEAIRAALEQAAFEGMASLELFNRSYWERDPLEVAKEGLAKMKAVLGGEG